MNAPVFVPNVSPLPVKILPGSAIVGGSVLNNGRLVVYFEGNTHGTPDLQRFVQRVRMAHSRLVTKYPTTAKAAFAPEELLQIGEYDPARMVVIVDRDKQAACKTWLGLETVTVDQLIWRNPLRVKDYPMFLAIVGTSEETREFHVVGERVTQQTPLKAAWDTKKAELKITGGKLKKPLETLIQEGRVYLTFPKATWGVGW